MISPEKQGATALPHLVVAHNPATPSLPSLPTSLDALPLLGLKAKMFILPAQALPFVDISLPTSASTTWRVGGLSFSLSYTRLLLILLTNIVFVSLVRSAILSRKRTPIAVAVIEKAEQAVVLPEAKRAGSAPVNIGDSVPASPRKWSRLFSFKSMAMPTLAEALPITLNPPPPPVMRGGHVYRGGRGVGFASRRSGSEASRSRADASMTAVYDSETPVSMAQMIMSRHTYRRPASPSPRRLAPSSLNVSRQASVPDLMPSPSASSV
ncbi:unnamed protein product [Mycena citricolor]|uniref:Uncharacterized protein n=1 Tax=Mycena citricolor TaxID=2018698 RepID=A0AAD2HI33_9AGAR|nr:unnamed protein product [Mycena citricolor]